MRDDLLRIYLNDHLAGSAAAVRKGEHCLEHNAGTSLAAMLETLLAELREEQDLVEDVLRRVGGAENRLKQAAAWVAEKASRAKPDGDLLGYSDLTRLEELEALLVGVTGKRALWQSLEVAGPDDARLRDLDLPALIRQSDRHLDMIGAHRLDAARRAFR